MPEQQQVETRSSSSSSVHVFLFVNPLSGGNAGSALTTHNSNEIVLQLHSERFVTLHIYDIRDGKSGKKSGFRLLKSHAERSLASAFPERIRVIVAGGDGTVLWCLSEMDSHGIGMDNVAVGVLPFGTGNDFARSLDWSLPLHFKPFDNNMQQLKSLVESWIGASFIRHDLWQVDIQAEKSAGEFLKISGEDREKKVMMDGDGKALKSLSLKMCNYFSLGVESRIGVGFDKNRTKSAFKNKLMYTAEGIKKTFFTPTLSIQDVVHDLSEENPKSGDTSVIFTTRPTEHALLCASMSLVAVNIPSFASGMDIWGSADRCGLQGKSLSGELLKTQLMGDGVLEFACFSSAASIGAEVADPGHAKRVYRGAGPFILNLNDVNGKKVYFQVDGEFFISRHPQKIRISQDRTITVMAHAGSKRQQHYLNC